MKTSKFKKTLVVTIFLLSVMSSYGMTMNPNSGISASLWCQSYEVKDRSTDEAKSYKTEVAFKISSKNGQMRLLNGKEIWKLSFEGHKDGVYKYVVTEQQPRYRFSNVWLRTMKNEVELFVIETPVELITGQCFELNAVDMVFK
jgi:hypothetical protein